MSERDRKKKDRKDKGKKLRRMREDVAQRHANAGPERPATDQADVVDYKQGTAADRKRIGRSSWILAAFEKLSLRQMSPIAGDFKLRCLQ